jgi:hypothetical protein
MDKLRAVLRTAVKQDQVTKTLERKIAKPFPGGIGDLLKKYHEVYSQDFPDLYQAVVKSELNKVQQKLGFPPGL